MDYINEINKLKKEKNAIILAHYYCNDEVQDIADYLGDSLNLSKIAASTEAKIIVFAGVHFMGETAKILSPLKKVLMPRLDAGCQMADMINESELKSYKEKNPETIIISYVNTTAEIKALSDCCCTSTNALSIIDYYEKMGKNILYCPDKNLGNYAMKKFDKKFDVWHGYCPIHDKVSLKEVNSLRAKHPNALLLAHPECPLDLVEMADFAGSTKQILDYVKTSSATEFIIATEEGILHQMKKSCPQKKFYLASSSMVCCDMKKVELIDIYNELKYECNEIVLEKNVIEKAAKSLNKMLELSK